MRVLLAGSGWLGEQTLRELRRRGHEVVAVWDRSASGRLATAAAGGGVKAITLASIGHPGWLQKIPELVVSAHCTWPIEEETLARCPKGGIGYHPSLLPLHRGGDAVRWAIHMRERVTGGTVFWLNNRPDGGPVLAQDWCFIRPNDTAESLWRRELGPMGVRLLGEAIDLVADGQAPRRDQDEALATWEPSFRTGRLLPSRVH
ncbi:MAG: methionyl-tRNA formyltransferase [Reyranella sp.]|nr:methionyl-tRNA formyltransferase [Reyranella sp.]